MAQAVKPVISIIVPCYNQGTFLSETLQSVLDQEYPYWECIIVNDGSTDNTEAIANEWAHKDNRFRYYRKENSGVSDTRNFAISKAEGKYILPLDGDDKVGSRYVAEAIDIFEKEPDTKLVYSDLILFGAKNKKLRKPGYIYKNLFEENFISVSGIFKKEDFEKTTGYNTNMVEGLEDWDFWLSFLHKDDKVVKLEGFHVFYRIKEVSRSTMIDYRKNERLLMQIFRNHENLLLEYLNPIRDYIGAEYNKREVESYKNCTELKIGLFLYAPVRFMQKVFKKLFPEKEE
ncbi:glycosyltransferase [Dysgonomonas sp. 511]|uniref:glycosyltransferase family 2 protein n=1 Tax=Dysgonomonas sp. 511 TaxID=2302930 RepID=UPI0013D73C4D|nr:glycosyltransferase [Dysgonomonas sp. 511]NDV78807.1 glycosyltransferase [Dysgonomonas sp. 511]